MRGLARRAVATVVPCAAVLALAMGARPVGASGPSVIWQEHFDRGALDWVNPFDSDSSKLSRVYALRTSDGLHVLHALHDYTIPSPPPALHYGKAFNPPAPALDKIGRLSWRWRVLRHPAVGPRQDPWLDLGASVYVLIRRPPLLIGSARGIKLGWTARPAPSGESQRGIVEVPLRADPAGPDWKTESVDLCAIYQRAYGAPCAGESVLYVGVLTDADGTKSVAEAEYADFEMDAVP